MCPRVVCVCCVLHVFDFAFGASQNWNKLVGATAGELAGSSLFCCLFLSKVVGWLLTSKLVERLLRELDSRNLGLLRFWPFPCVFFVLFNAINYFRVSVGPCIVFGHLWHYFWFWNFRLILGSHSNTFKNTLSFLSTTTQDVWEVECNLEPEYKHKIQYFHLEWTHQNNLSSVVVLSAQNCHLRSQVSKLTYKNVNPLVR